MKRLLIHPTHRKYIRLLRKCADSGAPIIITHQDAEDFLEMIKKSKQRLYRHQGFYRITLRAMNRPKATINANEIHTVLDDTVIDYIAQILAKVERRQLGVTLISAYIVPLLRKTIKVINRYEHKQRH